VQFSHVTLVGVNQVNAQKVLLTLALFAFVVVVRYALHIRRSIC